METVSPRIDGCGKSSVVLTVCGGLRDDLSACAKEIAFGAEAEVATGVGCTRTKGAAAGAKISACQSNGMEEAVDSQDRETMGSNNGAQFFSKALRSVPFKLRTIEIN